MFATSCGPPGSEIRVLDERGEIVIGIGVRTASALAGLRARAVRVDDASGPFRMNSRAADPPDVLHVLPPNWRSR